MSHPAAPFARHPALGLEELDAPRDELPPGHVLLHGQYRIERYLNSGGFGISYLARDSLDRRVVIKECFAGALCHRSATRVRARSRSHEGEFRAMVNLFLREARNLARLKHPNIVGVHQVFEDNDTAYMALDLVEGRDLLDIVKDEAIRLTPDMVQFILLKLLEAVGFMHGCDILHRDISPDNILLNAEGAPVLIDFGSAREEATKASRVLTGLLMVKDGYSPQEFYIAGSKQMPCSDLYALGATMYHLVTGRAPPDSQSRLAAIAAGAMDPCRPLTGRIGGYEPYFLAAIDKAMNVFPADRLQSAAEWLGQADPVRRRAAALAQLELDRTIEASIARFMAETVAALPEAPPIGRPDPSPAAETPALPPKVLEYIGFDYDEPACVAAPPVQARRIVPPRRRARPCMTRWIVLAVWMVPAALPVVVLWPVVVPAVLAELPPYIVAPARRHGDAFWAGINGLFISSRQGGRATDAGIGK